MSAENFVDTLLDEIKPLYQKARVDLLSEADEDDFVSIGCDDILRAHFCVVDHFYREGTGEGIGGIGPKDIGLLLSALNRPHVSYGGIQKWRSVHEKAATLLFGLAMNHPFYDANKRTAYLFVIYYLFSQGFMISITEKQLEDLTVLVVEKGLSKYPRYRHLRRTSRDPEIEFLGWFLRKNTHQIDRTQYLVSYRELEKLLKRYDVFFENPNKNSIDLMRWEEVPIPRRSIFSKKKTSKEIRRVCSLGFPGWNKQVGKGRLKYIRTELGLMPEDGVDSQAFFNGVDDMRVLLDIYEGALRRLAYR